MFIVLEGPDGAGTTLHSKLLAEKLIAEGHQVVLTAEPTDGSIGSWIRKELDRGALPASALQLLFCADRAEHVEKVIKPALAEGKFVVSDRYTLSTIAYGETFGVDRNWLKTINDAFPKPDVTILALPPISVCIERLNRRETRDMFEKEELQEKIHGAYKKLASELPEIHVVDTSGEKAAGASVIWDLVRDTL
jgi:dTMP kinase